MTHATQHTWHVAREGYVEHVVAPVYNNNAPMLDIREHMRAKQLRVEMLVKNSSRYDAHDATALNTPYAGGY